MLLFICKWATSVGIQNAVQQNRKLYQVNKPRIAFLQSAQLLWKGEEHQIFGNSKLSPSHLQFMGGKPHQTIQAKWGCDTSNSWMRLQGPSVFVIFLLSITWWHCKVLSITCKRSRVDLNFKKKNHSNIHNILILRAMIPNWTNDVNSNSLHCSTYKTSHFCYPRESQNP